MGKAPVVLIATGEPAQPRALVTAVQRMQATVLTAATCRQARRHLSTAAIDIVVTDVSLPDGNWCDLMTHLVKEGLHPSVVVRSSADDPCLWSEVLWRGAYDMLVEPFTAEESRRILEGALRASGYSHLDCVCPA